MNGTWYDRTTLSGFTHHTVDDNIAGIIKLRYKYHRDFSEWRYDLNDTKDEKLFYKHIKYLTRIFR